MTIEDQTIFLGWDKLNVLDVLNVKLHGMFQLTGSISLLSSGVIKRPIGDIDIVVNSLESIKNLFQGKKYELTEWFNYTDITENPKNTMQGRGKVTNRISFKIDNVKICAFYAKGQDFKKVEFMNQRFFKISHPKYLIEAKKRYIKDLLEKDTLNFFQNEKLKKHAIDIYHYNKHYQDPVNIF